MLHNTKSSNSDAKNKAWIYKNILIIMELFKMTNIIKNSDFLKDIFDKLYTHSLQGYSHHIKTHK